MRTSLSSLLMVATLGAALAGCGGQTSKRTSTAAGLEAPCRARSRALVAREVGAPVDAVSAVAGVASNSYPQCAYSTGAVRVVVNVDSGPQPYFVLERTAIEETQKFSNPRLAVPAVQVPGIGLDAFWYGAEQQFMTTDGVNLITVTVSWQAGSAARRQAVAKAVARSYLGKPVQPPGFGG